MLAKAAHALALVLIIFAGMTLGIMQFFVMYGYIIKRLFF